MEHVAFLRDKKTPQKKLEKKKIHSNQAREESLSFEMHMFGVIVFDIK